MEGQILSFYNALTVNEIVPHLARRQIIGGGVRINGEKIIDPNLEFDKPEELVGKILQMGKKKFLRVSN